VGAQKSTKTAPEDRPERAGDEHIGEQVVETDPLSAREPALQPLKTEDARKKEPALRNWSAEPGNILDCVASN